LAGLSPDRPAVQPGGGGADRRFDTHPHAVSDGRSLAGGSSREAAADLVVVGAGVMGAWTALLAQRAGRRAILVDAYGLEQPGAGGLLARGGGRAVVDACREAGGRFQHASVRPGPPAGDRIAAVVAEDGRELRGDQFVFACGPWLPRLFRAAIGDLIRVT